MRTKFSGILTLLLAFAVQLSFAQQKTISGTITDDTGLPLPGVNIVVKGTNTGTQSDFDGNYSIDVNVGQTLEFTYVGFATEERAVTASTSTVSFAMQSDASELDEIIITAYDQKRTRKSSMGARTTITAETLESRPSGSILNSLQGSVPGAAIQSNSGSPGSAQIDMIIRGRNSLNASSDPLFVIDGVIVGSAQFRNLNHQDIQSMDILRDAHETSIYGNRGANGVVVITTKRGKYNQPLSVKFNNMHGVFTLPKHDYNLANSREILTLQNRVGAQPGASLTEEEIANWDVDTNWLDYFFNTGINRQYNLSMEQGSENSNSFFSAGYSDVEGMVPTTNFNRFNLRGNLQGKTDNDRFSYEASLSIGYSKRNQLDSETNAGISNNVVQNPLFGSLLGLPYLESGLYPNGQSLFDAIGGATGNGNAIYILSDVLIPGQIPNQFTETNVLSSFSTSYKISESLTARNRTGIDYKHQTRNFARAPQSYLAIVVAASSGLEFPGFERASNTQDATISSVTSLNFDKTFNDRHHIQVGAFAEYIKAHYRASSLEKYGLIAETWELGSGTGFAPRDGDNYVPTVSLSKVDAGSFSYFATLDYELDGKYGIGGTIRRDAANKFRRDYQWGTFWSVAGRWVISDENFLSSSNNINLLKLRASYGISGNQILSVPAPDTNPLFLDSSLAWDYNTTGTGYLNNPIYATVLGNSSVQWEETSQANIGIDGIFFNNRLEGNIDVYQKVTNNLYNFMNLSGITGQYVINGNNGKLTNKGIELNLRYNLIRNDDFNLTVFANTSYNENKITDLESENLTPGGVVNAEGGPVRQFYLLNYLGVNEENGELLFADADGNPTETPNPDEDAVFTGKSNLPKWTGGFGLNAEYKGFYLDLNFSYQADFYKWDNALFWLYDGSSSSVSSFNVSADLLNAWTPENPTSNFPALDASNINFAASSDRYLYDASFIRLRNTVIGYNFPKKFLEGTSIKNMNVFLQGENLLLWSKWRGFDPEGYTNFSLGQYPNPRTISLGFNVEF